MYKIQKRVGTEWETISYDHQSVEAAHIEITNLFGKQKYTDAPKARIVLQGQEKDEVGKAA